MTLLELLLKDDFPVDELEDAKDFNKVIKKMKITTYESIKCELTYDEFLIRGRKPSVRSRSR